jgi:hypothetical protein
MTDLTPENVFVGTADGPGLWVAPLGTAAPTDEDEPTGDWLSVGYISEDETPTVGQEINTEDIGAWQSRDMIRRVLTTRTFTLGFTLIEVNPVSAGLWFDVEDPTDTDGAFSVELDTATSQQERAALLSILDGDWLLRFFFARTTLSEAGDVAFDKGNEVPLPVTLTKLASSTPSTFAKIPAVAAGP